VVSSTCKPFPHKRDRGIGVETSRFCLPQVVEDSVKHNMPVTLLTDRGTASETYQTCSFHYDLNPEMVPVRTTADFLNALANRVVALPNVAATDRAAVRRLIALLLCRTGWHIRPEDAIYLSPPLKRLLPRWVYPCARRWEAPR